MRPRLPPPWLLGPMLWLGFSAGAGGCLLDLDGAPCATDADCPFQLRCGQGEAGGLVCRPDPGPGAGGGSPSAGDGGAGGGVPAGAGGGAGGGGCGDDSQCVAGSHCGGGSCVVDLAPGAPCDRDAMCASGQCASYFVDADGDGYGSTAASTRCGSSASDPPPGFATNSQDCDDRSAAINPAATEIVGDEIDENCDGHELCWADADQDGFRSTATVVSSTTGCRGAGQAATAVPAGDCCDSDPRAHPGQLGWFATADGCGSFDYDCSGTSEPQLTSVGTSPVCQTLVLACVTLGAPGWVSAVPGCGQSAPYLLCNASCLTVTVSQQQTCH